MQLYLYIYTYILLHAHYSTMWLYQTCILQLSRYKLAHIYQFTLSMRNSVRTLIESSGIIFAMGHMLLIQLIQEYFL